MENPVADGKRWKPKSVRSSWIGGVLEASLEASPLQSMCFVLGEGNASSVDHFKFSL